jgi:Tol biopolymer transport system component
MLPFWLTESSLARCSVNRMIMRRYTAWTFAALIAFLAVPAAMAYTDNSPTWAPTDALVAFWRQGYTGEEAVSGIYIVASDGGQPRRIVADPGARWPSWSPEGRTIAYATETGRGAIQVLQLDASEQRRVSGTLRGYLSHPQWSPDGRMIAFHRGINRRANGRWRLEGEIWVVRPSGAGLRRVAAHAPFSPGTQPVPFSWSPRSDRLVYSGVQAGVRDLWTVGLDGRPPKRLLRSRAFDSAPVWSPDGTRIAFTGKETNDATRIYVLTLSRRTLAVAGSGLRPRWSPDGERLAFIGSSARAGVYVITLATGRVEKLLASDRGSGAPQWAADGNSIAVEAYGSCKSTLTGIYIIRPEGAQRVTNPCRA